MRLFPVILILAAVAPVQAQSRWKEIGTTSTNNTVYVDPRSVRKAKGIITARVRVKFTQPVATPQGAWTTSQTVAMFDCAKHTFAVKENVYYIDEATNKVAERKTNKIPGYSTPIKGSLSQVAMDYFCKP